MKTRQVTITNITYITPIQMDGPIVTPMTLSENIIRDLIRRGYNVIQEVNGTPVKLTMSNFNNPSASLAKPKPIQENANTTAVPVKRFENQAPVLPAPPIPTNKPVEPPKTEVETNYDFGKEVEAVDTSIAPDEEAVGRLFTGRPIPDVSPDVKAIAEVDISQEGTVEAGNVNTAQETSSENTLTDNSQTVRNNNNNRLQGKRKHKK